MNVLSTRIFFEDIDLELQYLLILQWKLGIVRCGSAIQSSNPIFSECQFPNIIFVVNIRW